MNSNAQLSDDSQKENTNNGNVMGAGAPGVPHVPPHHNQPLPPPHGAVQQPDLRKGPGGGQRPPSMVLRQSNAALVAPQPS